MLYECFDKFISKHLNEAYKLKGKKNNIFTTQKCQMFMPKLSAH